MKVASYSCAHSSCASLPRPERLHQHLKPKGGLGFLMNCHEPRACSFFPVLRLLFLFLLVNIADLKARS